MYHASPKATVFIAAGHLVSWLEAAGGHQILRIGWLSPGTLGGFVGFSLFLAGCASMGNTLAQDLAWEQWKKCDHFPNVRLKEIRPNGQVWASFLDAQVDQVERWRECMRNAAAEQAQRRTTAGSLQTVGAPLPPQEISGATSPSSIPAWKQGDEWAYRWESPRGKGTFVWSVDREEAIEGVQYYVVKSGTTREIYFRKADFAYYMDKVNGAVETRHTPPTNWVPWPLKSGKAWEVRYTRERPLARQTEEMVMACEAIAEEPHAVIAGIFNTVKVVCRNVGTGSISFEVWHSSDVKQMVRERTHFSYGVRERELIAFKLK